MAPTRDFGQGWNVTLFRLTNNMARSGIRRRTQIPRKSYALACHVKSCILGDPYRAGVIRIAKKIQAPDPLRVTPLQSSFQIFRPKALQTKPRDPGPEEIAIPW